MNHTDTSRASVETMTDLEYAIYLMTTGKTDPEFQARACERMDLAREELRRKIGTVEVAVDLVRDARDER
jgi:hypothetical protein